MVKIFFEVLFCILLNKDTHRGLEDDIIIGWTIPLSQKMDMLRLGDLSAIAAFKSKES